MDNQINSEENSTKRNVVLVILLIVSLGLAGFFLIQYFLGLHVNNPEPIENQIKKFDLPKSENPVGIPYNLPIDPGVKIDQNYESTTTDGRLQSTKSFTTSASVQASLEKYHKFFSDYGWQRNSSGPLESPLAYKSPLGALMIVVNPSSSGNGSVVEITVLQEKPNSENK